jgi:hypothetical protein
MVAIREDALEYKSDVSAWLDSPLSMQATVDALLNPVPVMVTGRPVLPTVATAGLRPVTVGGTATIPNK